MKKTIRNALAAALAALLPAAAPAVTNESTTGRTAPPPISLASTMPDWLAVLNGNLLCPPARNSFGFILADEGRTVRAYTQAGTLLWQRKFKTRIKPFISVGPADMIYLVTRNGDLSLLNPGGLTLWTVRTGMDITEPPQAGRDGRVFVRGPGGVACYGIKGVCRWSVELESQNTALPLVQMNDGSLLVFNKKTVNGRSTGRLISPFGEVGKEIVFAARVTQAEPCSGGALLAFSDGSAGLAAEEGGSLSSAWAVRRGTRGFDSPTSIVVEGFPPGQAAFLTGSPATVILMDAATGQSVSTFPTEFSPAAILYRGKTSQGLVLADQRQSVCYDDTGGTVWQVLFDARRRPAAVFPTDGGYLGICTADWSLLGYHVRQDVGGSQSTYRSPELSGYGSFYQSAPEHSGEAFTSRKADEAFTAFRRGSFGSREREWIPALTEEMDELAAQWLRADSLAQAQTYLQANMDLAEKILNVAAACGTTAFQKQYATMLRRVTDPSMLIWLVRNAGGMAFDPDGSLLGALEGIVRRKSSGGNEVLLRAVCDATYEICRFMGRPAFFARGKGLLLSLMAPQYAQPVRDYARSTLERFMDAGL